LMMKMMMMMMMMMMMITHLMHPITPIRRQFVAPCSIVDAILGALTLPDIGELFPGTKPS